MFQVETFARQQLELLLAAAQPTAGAAAASDGDPTAADASQPAAPPEAAAGDPGPAAAGAAADDGQPTEADVVTATRRCGLYCALCTKRHSLLPRLLEVRAQSRESVPESQDLRVCDQQWLKSLGLDIASEYGCCKHMAVNCGNDSQLTHMRHMQQAVHDVAPSDLRC